MLQEHGSSVTFVYFHFYPLVMIKLSSKNDNAAIQEALVLYGVPSTQGDLPDQKWQ